MLIKKQQVGDTIIEVLIAITVVTLVLAGAYASSRRSLNTTLKSRERDEAVKLIQSQVELLGVALQAGTPSVYTQNSRFCLLPASPITMLLATNPLCTHDSTDSSYSAATSPSTPYNLAIERNFGGDPNLYSATATWDRAGGGGTEQARILYRAYKQ